MFVRQTWLGKAWLESHMYAKKFCLTIFVPLDIALEDVSLNFIEKTDSSTEEECLRLWHHLGLISKKVSGSLINKILSICIFIGLLRF